MKGRGEGGSGGEIPAGAEAGRPAEKAGASACGKARRPAAWAEEGPPAGGRKAPPAGAGTGGAEAKPAPGAGREAAKGRVQVSLRNGRRYASHHLYVGGKGGRKGLQAFYLGKVIDLERGIFLHAERGLFSYDVERGFGEAAIGPAPPGTEGLAASIAARESRGGGLGRIQVSERANSSYACHVMSYRDGNRSGHRMFYLGKVLDLGRGVFVHTKRGVFSYDIARGFGEEAVSPAPAGFEDAAARLLGGGRRRPEAGGPGWRRRRAAEDGESSFATVPLPTPWKAVVRFGDVWLFDRIAGDSGLKAAVIETLGGGRVADTVLALAALHVAGGGAGPELAEVWREGTGLALIYPGAVTAPSRLPLILEGLGAPGFRRDFLARRLAGLSGGGAPGPLAVRPDLRKVLLVECRAAPDGFAAPSRENDWLYRRAEGGAGVILALGAPSDWTGAGGPAPAAVPLAYWPDAGLPPDADSLKRAAAELRDAGLGCRAAVTRLAGRPRQGARILGEAGVPFLAALDPRDGFYAALLERHADSLAAEPQDATAAETPAPGASRSSFSLAGREYRTLAVDAELDGQPVRALVYLDPAERRLAAEGLRLSEEARRRPEGELRGLAMPLGVEILLTSAEDLGPEEALRLYRLALWPEAGLGGLCRARHVAPAEGFRSPGSGRSPEPSWAAAGTGPGRGELERRHARYLGLLFLSFIASAAETAVRGALAPLGLEPGWAFPALGGILARVDMEGAYEVMEPPPLARRILDGLGLALPRGRVRQEQ